MRILIADKFEKSGLDGFQAAGCEVVYQPGLKDEGLAQEVERSRPDVLVVRSTKVGESIIGAGSLKLIVRAGAGYNTIDVAAASRRGIYVSNCPGKNSVAVAELAFGLILALDRRIADNVASLREGQWKKAEYSKGRGLYGRTLGLIGLGQIGREMVPRAKGFGMRVVGWSRRLTDRGAAELGIVRADSPEEVAASADAVSVHLALNSETRGVLGTAFFDAMKAGAIFVNTARAEVADAAALRGAITSGRIFAGLDVFANEPAGGSGDFADEIVKSGRVYGTHHIGASTEQAQEAIAAETVRIVRAFKESGQVPNVVNLAKATPSICILVVRHLDRPGVLAGVLDAISAAHINVQEMENIVFEGAQAAVARIHLEAEPDQALMEQIRSGNAHILELAVIRLEN